MHRWVQIIKFLLCNFLQQWHWNLSNYIWIRKFFLIYSSWATKFTLRHYYLSNRSELPHKIRKGSTQALFNPFPFAEKCAETVESNVDSWGWSIKYPFISIITFHFLKWTFTAVIQCGAVELNSQVRYRNTKQEHREKYSDNVNCKWLSI
jgi:hypothetical protein